MYLPVSPSGLRLVVRLLRLLVSPLHLHVSPCISLRAPARRSAPSSSCISPTSPCISLYLPQGSGSSFGSFVFLYLPYISMYLPVSPSGLRLVVRLLRLLA